MTVLFRDVVESGVPDVPFVAGQVIRVSVLSPAMQRALAAGQAEVLRDDTPEMATVTTPERAVRKRGRRRAA